MVALNIQNNREAFVKKNRGFSLVEILIGVALLTILMISFLDIQTLVLKIFTNSSLNVTRTALRSNSEKYISDLSVINKSSKYRGANSSGNEMLDYCLNGPPIAPNALCTAADYPNCCTRNTNLNPQSFYIIDPADSTGSKKFSGVSLTSQPAYPVNNIADPVYYSTDGSSCTTPSPNCPLQLSSWYIADCPGSVARCTKSNQILIKYDLDRAPGTFSLASFKNSTNTIQLTMSVSASGSGLSWAGYSAKVQGDFGYISGTSSNLSFKKGNDLCNTSYSGSHWASYEEILKLGADYPYSEPAWMSFSVLASFNGGNDFILKNGAICSGGPGTYTGFEQCFCSSWKTNMAAFKGLALDVNGDIVKHPCNEQIALACVK